ncbi:MAG TPA: response regulator transcription factor [Gammaproteobacteria bacterium]|nr:response regulator transcription factor [Gammaproteobacteria bacterium]
MRILIIEDNRDILENVAQYLEGKGHVLDFAEDGITGLHLATVNAYDIIVLDLMLPGMDGLDVCRKLRKDAILNTPILMLTARDSLNDKLSGFEAGGDDYLVKPFALAELEARIKSLVRRLERQDPVVLRVADLEFDTSTIRITRGGQTIHLRPITRRILLMLMKNSHRVVSRSEIERAIWEENLPDGDSLRAHIYAIRNAIDKPFVQKLLHTVHGTGFRLCSSDEK